MIMNSNLNRELKKYAAEIALHHHERIDGSGYQIKPFMKRNKRLDSGSSFSRCLYSTSK